MEGLREWRASTPFRLCRCLDGMRAEPGAVGLLRTFAGDQSVKLGSVQSIVRPTPEFATSPAFQPFVAANPAIWLPALSAISEILLQHAPMEQNITSKVRASEECRLR
jgi:hypothetical protein